MIEIAEILGPRPTPLWNLVKQAGVRHAVGVLPFGESGGETPWDYTPLLHMKQRFEDAGLTLAAIESRPPLDCAKRGLEGRNAEIAAVCTLLENMGRLGIPVWCYEWMAVFNWMRTDTAIPARRRAGQRLRSRPHARSAAHRAGVITEEQLWASLEYFLRRVVPVAEKWNVKLAMHPDDPPLSPIRGVGRIMRSAENFQRLLDLVPSPVNGITLCQGNFALMTGDLPATIRRFGRQGKIFFVYLRDVRGTPERFVETFHDDGQTDLLACLRAYRDIGFAGVLRPDHVPTMEGENNDHPGYAAIGRLFAIGYIKGLRQAVYTEEMRD